MENVIVSCQWLDEHLHDDNIVILDASMTKVVGKTPLEYPTLQVIPTSLRCDLERDLCDLKSESVNAFPTEQQFEAALAKFGITKHNTVVVYDNQGVYSSPRAWWIFKSMGFDNVCILDGGLPQWLKEYREVDTKHKVYANDNNNVFTATYQANNVCHADYVLGTIADDHVTVVDVRSPSRFSGIEKEPRLGVRAGHIPNAINIPFGQVLDSFTFKTPEALTTLFNDRLPDTTNQLVFSCGSGITACIVLAAAHITVFTDLVLYDGSWSEWGSSNYPIET